MAFALSVALGSPSGLLRAERVGGRRQIACPAGRKKTASNAAAMAHAPDLAKPEDPVRTPPAVQQQHQQQDLQVDSVIAKELAENGFRSTRRTKLICTIGPSCDSEEMLDLLAQGGMNVARLNMAHGGHDYQRTVINRIRQLNKDRGYSVAIQMDTEGSEVHIMHLPEGPIKAEVGQEYTFTMRDAAFCTGNQLAVSYEAFAEDMQPGDMVVVDGGMASLQVVGKAGPDVTARVVDPGIILSRANLTFRRGGSTMRGKHATLPVISAKDWRDIDFAISQDVDFIAVSFVKSGDVMQNLRSYVESRANRVIELIAKIESFDAVPKISEIVAASDAVMVARGDLGAQIRVEDVPSVQKEIVLRCRQQGKPVIVASQLLQSMMELPTPTRAEVSDISEVVRQRADALMLSGESAAGRYPTKALEVLRTVAARMEEWVRTERRAAIALPQIAPTGDGRASEELCNAAALLANNLGVRAIFVFTRRGYMANWLARCRPDAPIFAFTDSQETRQRLNLRWGVMPMRMDFSDSFEDNIQRSFMLLKRRELAKPGDLVVVVSDIRLPGSPAGVPEPHQVRSVQVRHVT